MLQRARYPYLNQDRQAVTSTYLGTVNNASPTETVITINSGGFSSYGTLSFPTKIPDMNPRMDRTLFGFILNCNQPTESLTGMSIDGNVDNVKIYNFNQANVDLMAFACQLKRPRFTTHVSFRNTYSANIAINIRVAMWCLTGLQLPFPIDAQSSGAATDITRSVDLMTKSGGVVIAAALNNVTAAQSCTWTGDQTPNERVDTTGNNAYSAADITNTNDDPANTITATHAVISTTGINLAAVSFR